MSSDAKRQGNARYQKNKTKVYSFKFVLSSDSDIIDWLDCQSNKQAAIKRLIRNEIARTGNNQSN